MKNHSRDLEYLAQLRTQAYDTHSKGSAPDPMPNMYCINLLSSEIKLNPGNAFSCFLIVQHTKDPTIIQRIARQMLSAGCRNFVFYGKHEPLWHAGFDDMDTLLNPDAEAEDVALTSGSSTLEDFVDELSLELSWYHSEPYDILLLYDDNAVFERTLSMLQDTD